MERTAKGKNWIVAAIVLGLCCLVLFEWDRRNYVYPEFLNNSQTLDDLVGEGEFERWLWRAKSKPWEASEWLWGKKKQRLERQFLADLQLENTIWEARVVFSPRKHWDLNNRAIHTAELKFLDERTAVFSRNLRFNDLRIPLKVKVERPAPDQISLIWGENRVEFDLKTTARRAKITKPIVYSAQSIRDIHALNLLKR